MQVIIRKIVYLLNIIHNELLDATKREVIRCDNPLFLILLLIQIEWKKEFGPKGCNT